LGMLVLIRMLVFSSFCWNVVWWFLVFVFMV